jgi:hypothetical protein
VYVRCEERECQYADLNEAPCPLRVEMFADGSDRLVADYLAAHAGQRFCYACLTETLGVTHDQVRRASWRLKDESGCTIRPSRCSACHFRRVTISFTATGVKPAPFATAAPHVAAAPSPAPVRAGLSATLDKHLRRHAGYAFCPHCLARELSLRPSEAREAMWALEADAAFLVRTTQCVSCLLTKPVIVYREEPPATGGPRRLIEVVVKSGVGVPVCASCIAFASDLALADVRRTLKDLAGLADFLSVEAECATCGRWQPTIALAPDADGDGERIAEIADVVSGRARYRGMRIDLLSFRTTGGWRPFALVRSAVGALTPDAPPIVLDVVPTKIEADAVAAMRAREWIDKRFP